MKKSVKSATDKNTTLCVNRGDKSIFNNNKYQLMWDAEMKCYNATVEIKESLHFITLSLILENIHISKWI